MPRADLRLADLHQSAGGPAKLMNVKVPVDVAVGIERVAGELGCTKTAAVIALMNEGLDAFDARRDEFTAPARPRRTRRGRPPMATEAPAAQP